MDTSLRRTATLSLAQEAWEQFKFQLLSQQNGNLTPDLLSNIQPFYQLGFCDGYEWQEDQGDKASDIIRGGKACWQKEYDKAKQMAGGQEPFDEKAGAFFENIFRHGFVAGIAKYKEL